MGRGRCLVRAAVVAALIGWAVGCSSYSHLSAAPAGGTQGYVYVPGTPVAIWQ